MTIDVLPDEPDPVRAVHLPGGEKVTVRPARPQDTSMIQAYIRGLSPASRRNRFLGALNEISSSELHGMTHGDRCRHPALIAEGIVDGACTMIGEARYAVAPDGLNGEFAVSVAETWRRKTLAMMLVGIVALQRFCPADPDSSSAIEDQCIPRDVSFSRAFGQRRSQALRGAERYSPFEAANRLSGSCKLAGWCINQGRSRATALRERTPCEVGSFPDGTCSRHRRC